MYDFPASPSNGQQFGNYTFDGEKWTGGLSQGPSGGEQLFNIAGVSQFEVTVPSWARSVQIQQCAFLSAAGQTGLQVSADGTAWVTGATDYQYMGFVQNTGSSGFASVPQQAFSEFIMSPAVATHNPAIPFVADYVLELQRPTTSQVMHLRGIGRSLDNAAASLARQFEVQGWVTTAALGSNLRVQKFRIRNSAGNFGTGSYLKVKWIGDSAALPNGVSIIDAPADGNEYVRVNNLWRLKRQEFSLPLAASSAIVQVPAWNPKFAKVHMFIGQATGAYESVCFRASEDGTNFVSVANSYYVSAAVGVGTTVTYSAITAYALGYLAFAANNNSVGYTIDALFTLKRLANSTPTWISRASCYDNTTGQNYKLSDASGYLSTGFSGAQLRALQFFMLSGGGTFAVPTENICSVEWL